MRCGNEWNPFSVWQKVRGRERGGDRERKTATDWDRLKWFGRTEQSRATREHDEMNRILLKYENPKCTFFIGTTQAGSKFWAHSVLKESMNSIIHWNWSWMWKNKIMLKNASRRMWLVQVVWRTRFSVILNSNIWQRCKMVPVCLGRNKTLI